MQKTYFKIGLFGTSGSGKTYSSIRLAKGLVSDVSKIVIINTEDQITNIYKKRLGMFHVEHFGAPYDPLRYVKAIEHFVSKGFEAIIVDSISHEWNGKGGCLELHNQFGGDFKAWAKVTPLHNQFIEAIVKAPCHIIACGRKKQEYSMDRDTNGRTKIQKVGLEIITRDGFDYELTCAFDLDQRHYATPTKDRTGIFLKGEEPIPFIITEETGQLLTKEFNNEEEK